MGMVTPCCDDSAMDLSGQFRRVCGNRVDHEGGFQIVEECAAGMASFGASAASVIAIDISQRDSD